MNLQTKVELDPAQYKQKLKGVKISNLTKTLAVPRCQREVPRKIKATSIREENSFIYWV